MIGTDRPDNRSTPVVLYSDQPHMHPLYGDLTGPVRPTLLVNHREPPGIIALAYADTGVPQRTHLDGSSGFGGRGSPTGSSAKYLRYVGSNYNPPGKLLNSNNPKDD